MGERLSGEAAWKAAKEQIAKRNEAVQARARDARVASEAEATERRLATDREQRRRWLAGRPEH